MAMASEAYTATGPGLRARLLHTTCSRTRKSAHSANRIRFQRAPNVSRTNLLARERSFETRSKGGYGSKFHILVDGNGTPLEVDISAGQVHDSQKLEPILNKVKVKQKQGRPKSRPKKLAGTKPTAVIEFVNFLRIEALRR